MKGSDLGYFALHIGIGYALQVALLQGRWYGLYLVLFPYVFGLLALPMQSPRAGLLLLGFGTGLLADLLYDTLGVHALACLVLTFIRPWIIQTMASDSLQKMYLYPRTFAMGWAWYLVYAATLITIHHALIYLLDAGLWRTPIKSGLQWLASSAMTLSLCCLWELIAPLFRKKL